MPGGGEAKGGSTVTTVDSGEDPRRGEGQRGAVPPDLVYHAERRDPLMAVEWKIKAVRS